jgi:hypothetical protein
MRPGPTRSGRVAHRWGKHYPDVTGAQLALAEGQKESAMTADNKVLVGVPGFEPGASCSQSRRATGLRHTPLGWIASISENSAFHLGVRVGCGAVGLR